MKTLVDVDVDSIWRIVADKKEYGERVIQGESGSSVQRELVSRNSRQRVDQKNERKDKIEVATATKTKTKRCLSVGLNVRQRALSPDSDTGVSPASEDTRDVQGGADRHSKPAAVEC